MIQEFALPEHWMRHRHPGMMAANAACHDGKFGIIALQCVDSDKDFAVFISEEQLPGTLAEMDANPAFTQLASLIREAARRLPLPSPRLSKQCHRPSIQVSQQGSRPTVMRWAFSPRKRTAAR